MLNTIPDYVTVTSQGQISIPASVRRQLDLKKSQKLRLIVEDGKIILTPAVDILELRGVFSEYRMKDMSPQEIERIETEAYAEATTEKTIASD